MWGTIPRRRQSYISWASPSGLELNLCISLQPCRSLVGYILIAKPSHPDPHALSLTSGGEKDSTFKHIQKPEHPPKKRFSTVLLLHLYVKLCPELTSCHDHITADHQRLHTKSLKTQSGVDPYDSCSTHHPTLPPRLVLVQPLFGFLRRRITQQTDQKKKPFWAYSQWAMIGSHALHCTLLIRQASDGLLPLLVAVRFSFNQVWFPKSAVCSFPLDMREYDFHFKAFHWLSTMSVGDATPARSPPHLDEWADLWSQLDLKRKRLTLNANENPHVFYLVLYIDM